MKKENCKLSQGGPGGAVGHGCPGGPGSLGGPGGPGALMLLRAD